MATLVRISILLLIAALFSGQAFLFFRTGQFVKQLGRIGKGPGEFVTIRNISLSTDEIKAAIFDPERQRTIIYTTGSSEFQEIGITGYANEVIFGSDQHLLASYGYPLCVTKENCQFSWINIID